MFQLILIISCIFNLIKSSKTIDDQCPSGWYYLFEENLCIIFASSQAGDISWYDGYKACQTSSAEYLSIFNLIKFQSVEKKFNQLKSNNQFYFNIIKQGAWIGKASKINE